MRFAANSLLFRYIVSNVLVVSKTQTSCCACYIHMRAFYCTTLAHNQEGRVAVFNKIDLCTERE